MNQPNIGININFGDTIAELKSSYELFKENKTYNKEEYCSLLEKYAESIKIIEQLKQQIEDLKKNKLPTKDEVESVSAMLDILSKIDSTTLDKINNLGAKKNV